MHLCFSFYIEKNNLIIALRAEPSQAPSPSAKQNVWLEMSPYPRPAYGWVDTGNNY